MTNRIPLVVAVCSVAIGCSGERAGGDAPAAEPAKAPAAAARVDPVESARKRVAEVDAMRERSPDRVGLWARVTGQAELVPVRDTASWPADIEASINTWTDERGRPIAFAETPYLESGDEYVEATHWFDEYGRTVAYQMHVSSFGSGCAEIVRDTRRTLYDASFRPVRQDTTHTDGDGRPIPADCQGPGDWSADMRPEATYDALVREGRAPRLPPR